MLKGTFKGKGSGKGLVKPDFLEGGRGQFSFLYRYYRRSPEYNIRRQKYTYNKN